MYRFHDKKTDFLYFLWRLVSPILDPLMVIKGVTRYPVYIRDLLVYKAKPHSESILLKNLYPQLHDVTPSTPFLKHYFYQELWCFEQVKNNKPCLHIDIGSTYQMSGYISKLTKAVFVDIRPLDVELKNLNVVVADITRLPYRDGELESISCLHVIEHIGLGRYGDSLDPEGHVKAIRELKRILKQGGRLYVSVPIGKPCLYFNAHRVFSPEFIVSQFSDLALTSFGVVDDRGRFTEHPAVPDWVKDQDYACGMFCFTKGL